MKENKEKENPHPSRMRGRGVEVSKTLFYFVSAKIKSNSKLAEDVELIMKYITINLDLSTV